MHLLVVLHALGQNHQLHTAAHLHHRLEDGLSFLLLDVIHQAFGQFYSAHGIFPQIREGSKPLSKIIQHNADAVLAQLHHVFIYAPHIGRGNALRQLQHQHFPGKFIFFNNFPALPGKIRP